MLEIAIILALFRSTTEIAHARGRRSPLPSALAVFHYHAVAIATAVATGLPFIDVIAGGAAGFTVSLAVWIWPRVDSRAPKGRGFPYGLVAVLLVLYALAIALGRLYMLSPPSGPQPAVPEYLEYLRTAQGGGGATVTLLVLILLVYYLAIILDAAVGAFELHRRGKLPTIEEVMAHDPRPPVLLLRDFSDVDRRRWAEGMPAIEAEIGPAVFMRVGPFIALQNPEEILPSHGAAKTHVPDSQWQEEVRRLADRASCVLIEEGCSAGLRWEINHVTTTKDPACVFFLTRPAAYATWPTRFVFEAILEGHGWKFEGKLPNNAILISSGERVLTPIPIEGPESVAQVLVDKVRGAAPIPHETLTLASIRRLITPYREPRPFYSRLRPIIGWCALTVIVIFALEIGPWLLPKLIR